MKRVIVLLLCIVSCHAEQFQEKKTFIEAIRAGDIKQQPLFGGVLVHLPMVVVDL